MKLSAGILAALTLFLTAFSAQAYYSVSGDISAAVAYYSGPKDFFRNTAILDVEKIRGTFDFTTTRELPQPYAPGNPTYDILYYGTANYSFSLLDAGGNTLISYSASGTPAHLDVVNCLKDGTYSVQYGIDLLPGASIGGNYALSSFSASTYYNSPNSSFSFNFNNAEAGTSGNISGDFSTSSVAFSPALAFTPPPVPTPIPPAMPLLGSGLALAGLLRLRRKK